MRIGLNLVYLERESGGSGTYARELVSAIRRVEPASEITVWLGRGAPPDVVADLRAHARTDVVRLPVRSTGSPMHVPVELLWLGVAAARRRLDVVHGLAYAAPIVGPVPSVVTIHDLTWLHVPTAVSHRARWMLGTLTKICVARCDRVLAVSTTAGADLVRNAGVDPAKLSITPLGAPTPTGSAGPDERVLERLGLNRNRPVILAVGQLAAHKNYLRLIDAAALLNDIGVSIVIAGRRTPHADDLERRAIARSVDLRARGFVDDGDLAALYRFARLVILPSVAEGFGLPVLEAMAHGTPVACSDIGVLREVTAGAAEFFDPSDPCDIARACRRLLTDEARHAELVAWGRRRAAQLTWDRTARATLAAYRETMRC